MNKLLLRIEFFYLTILLVAAFFSFSAEAMAQNLTVELETTEIPQDGIGKIRRVTFGNDEIPFTQLNAENFQVSSESHTVKFIQDQFPGFKISGKAGETSLKFTYIKDGASDEADLTVNVLPVWNMESLQIEVRKEGEETEKFNLGEGLKMLSTDVKQIRIIGTDLNDDPVTESTITLSIDSADAVKFNEPDTKAEIQSGVEFVDLIAQRIRSKEAIQEVLITNGNQQIGKFNVKVVDKIVRDTVRVFDKININAPESFDITAGSSPRIYNLALQGESNLPYNNNNIPEGAVSASSDKPNLVKVDVKDNKLFFYPQKVPPGTESDNLVAHITLKVTQLSQDIYTNFFSVQLEPPIAVIDFRNGAAVTLPRDGTVAVSANVRGSGGNMLDADFDWNLSEEDKRWVAVSSEGNEATVIWKRVSPALEKQRPNFVELTVNATTDGGNLVTSTVIVNMVSIDRFSLMKVRLNPLDRRTVRDLFGSVTDEEYYVISVRMYNNLKDDKTDEYIGASILVYNGSFEVSVLLQKQYDKDTKSVHRRNAKKAKSDDLNSYKNPDLWFDVTKKDLDSITSPDSEYEYPKDPNDTTRDLKKVLTPFPGDPLCNETFRYRPLTFEMAINTVDPRDSRRFRTRIFNGLKLLGTAGSFASSVKLFRGADTNLVLDQFSNLLIPGLEEVFPSLKEVHRQNVVSMTMKPIEEIPFGTDINRVIFIPKKAIYGLLQDHRVRISQICPFNFKVEVAVIRRGDKVEIQQRSQR